MTELAGIHLYAVSHRLKRAELEHKRPLYRLDPELERIQDHAGRVFELDPETGEYRYVPQSDR